MALALFAVTGWGLAITFGVLTAMLSSYLRSSYKREDDYCEMVAGLVIKIDETNKLLAGKSIEAERATKAAGSAS